MQNKNKKYHPRVQDLWLIKDSYNLTNWNKLQVLNVLSSSYSFSLKPHIREKFKNIYSCDSQLKLIKESCHMSSRDKLTLMFQEAYFAKYMNKVKKLLHLTFVLDFLQFQLMAKLIYLVTRPIITKKTMHM